MSGPDAGRGPDGGEAPLDVDARFADIIAHFHDDEPSRPTVVDDADGADDPAGAGDPAATGGAAGGDGTTATADGPRPERPDRGRPAAGPDGERPDGRRPDTGAGAPELSTPSTDPVRDLAAPADLAAMRRSYEARIAAEVDRAVDGPDGGRFVPAEPPPLPRPDLPGRLAWGAVLVGPVLLLLFALFWRSAPSWVLGSVVTAIVAGFGYLVWRLPRTRDRDDPGDGAIV